MAVMLFDLNQTLLDVRVLDPHFQRLFVRAEYRDRWLSQLLELALTGVIAGEYRSFSELADAALVMLAQRHGVPLAMSDRERIAHELRRLPVQADVLAALEKLRQGGHRLAALTNSPQELADAQVAHSGLAPLLERVISSDRVRRHKPAVEPYQLAVTDMDADPTTTWMVTAHAWDLAGARAAGLRTAFVRRTGKELNPLAPPPDLVLEGLAELPRRFDPVVQPT